MTLHQTGYGTFSYRIVAVAHDYRESDPSAEVTATIEDRSFPPVPFITDIDGNGRESCHNLSARSAGRKVTSIPYR